MTHLLPLIRTNLEQRGRCQSGAGSGDKVMRAGAAVAPKTNFGLNPGGAAWGPRIRISVSLGGRGCRTCLQMGYYPLLGGSRVGGGYVRSRWKSVCAIFDLFFCMARDNKDRISSEPKFRQQKLSLTN